jgi:hypothetical protein
MLSTLPIQYTGCMPTCQACQVRQPCPPTCKDLWHWQARELRAGLVLLQDAEPHRHDAWLRRRLRHELAEHCLVGELQQLEVAACRCGQRQGWECSGGKWRCKAVCDTSVAAALRAILREEA